MNGPRQHSISENRVGAPDAPLFFSNDSLWSLRRRLIERLGTTPVGAALEIVAADPDLFPGAYDGELVDVDGRLYRARSYKGWLDLAETLNLSMLTPKPREPPHVLLRFRRLDPKRAQPAETDAAVEKYGPGSEFARIEKYEEPHFLHDMIRALEWIGLGKNSRVLDLGANRGDGWMFLRRFAPEGIADSLSYVGVDHSPSAIAAARNRFPATGSTFIEDDVNRLASLNLELFDLVLCLDLLQSPSVDSQAALSWLTKRGIAAKGGLIIGLPNARYLDGQIKYGGRLKRVAESELSLVVKDAAGYRRLLQRRGFSVRVFGKYETLIVARRKPSPLNAPPGTTASTAS